MQVLVPGVVVAAVSAGALRAFVAGHADLSTAGTVFCGVFVQALPFLGLGVVVSGLIAVFVSPERLARWLPKRTGAAILAAGISGAALPGCECGSVLARSSLVSSKFFLDFEMGICPRLPDLTRYSAGTIAAVFAGVGFAAETDSICDKWEMRACSAGLGSTDVMRSSAN